MKQNKQEYIDEAIEEFAVLYTEVEQILDRDILDKYRKLLEQKLSQAYERGREESNSEEIECQDCGVKDDTVVMTNCPYAEDVGNDSSVMITVCKGCLHERAMDI